VVAPDLTEMDATAGLLDGVREATVQGTPLAWLGQPDASRFVTGTYVPVSGGAFMS
jgi:hypothetical protein